MGSKHNKKNLWFCFQIVLVRNTLSLFVPTLVKFPSVSSILRVRLKGVSDTKDLRECFCNWVGERIVLEVILTIFHIVNLFLVLSFSMLILMELDMSI